MTRELNPNLFNSGASFIDPTPQLKLDKGPDRSDLRRIEGRIDEQQDRVSEVLKTTALKTEKMVQRMSQIETRLDSTVQELRQKYATLAGRVTERTLFENQVQSLLDRHNQIVKNFENRMTQMQRVIEQQQLQIMNSQAALEEARRDMARIKSLKG